MPGSQDSVTRGVQNLQISDTPTIHTARSAPAPPPMPNSRRPPQARPKQQPQECLRCAQCGSDSAAFRAVSDHGLMLHMVRKHREQQLLPESVAQLRHLEHIHILQRRDTPEALTGPPAPASPPMPNSRTHPQAVEATASMWSRSFRFQRSLGPRPQVTHGSETLRTTAHPREHCTGTQF